MINKGLIKVKNFSFFFFTFLQINYKSVKDDYIVKNGDKCQFTNGNILEPVSLYFDEIEVIYEDEDLFVVNSKKNLKIY